MTISNSPPRRKWRFRFFQFSIRTMLLITAAVAVFCNWYFQPQRKDEELAGGTLKLRRQVKVEMRDAPTSGRGMGPFAPQPGTKAPFYINHGSWSLLDKEENLLARGQYANDVPIGSWTVWHVSGKKAAEGRLKNGAKTGVWRTWYEDGAPQSEVTYSSTAPPAQKSAAPRRKKSPLQPAAFPREGTAKAWYPSGKLKFEGTYQEDREEGLWKLYDEKGVLTASGPYLHGQRHGEWSIVDAAGQETKTEFIHGRKADELRAILAALTKKLQSENASERLRATLDLAELGEDALPSLTIALAHPSDETKIAAVRGLLRLGPAAAPALPKLKELADAKADSPVKFHASLAVYVIDPAARENLYKPLLEKAVELSDLGETLDAFGLIFECDEGRHKETLKRLLAWEAAHDARAGLVGTLVRRSETDILGILDDIYSSLHITSRRIVAESLSGLVFYESVSRSHMESLAAKIKAESDPQLKDIGEQLEAALKNGGYRGGGMF